MIQLLIPAEENESLIKEICATNNFEMSKSDEAAALAEFMVTITLSSIQVVLQCVQILQQHKSLKDERVSIIFPDGVKIENAPLKTIEKVVRMEMKKLK